MSQRRSCVVREVLPEREETRRYLLLPGLTAPLPLLSFSLFSLSLLSRFPPFHFPFLRLLPQASTWFFQVLFFPLTYYDSKAMFSCELREKTEGLPASSSGQTWDAVTSASHPLSLSLSFSPFLRKHISFTFSVPEKRTTRRVKNSKEGREGIFFLFSIPFFDRLH